MKSVYYYEYNNENALLVIGDGVIGVEHKPRRYLSKVLRTVQANNISFSLFYS